MAIGALFAILYNTKAMLLTKYCFKNFTQITGWSIFLIAAANSLNVSDFINHDIFSLATGIIIINVAFNPKPLINLENKLFNFLGRISYGIYVYHVIIIFLLGKLLINRIPVFNSTLQIIILVVLVLLITIAIAFVSYNFYEKKFLLLKTKFSKILSRS